MLFHSFILLATSAAMAIGAAMTNSLPPIQTPAPDPELVRRQIDSSYSKSILYYYSTGNSTMSDGSVYILWNSVTSMSSSSYLTTTDDYWMMCPSFTVSFTTSDDITIGTRISLSGCDIFTSCDENGRLYAASRTLECDVLAGANCVSDLLYSSYGAPEGDAQRWIYCWPWESGKTVYRTVPSTRVAVAAFTTTSSISTISSTSNTPLASTPSKTNTSTNTPTSTSTPDPAAPKSNVPAIAGSVVGGVAVITIGAVLLFIIRRRSRLSHAAAVAAPPTPATADLPEYQPEKREEQT